MGEIKKLKIKDLLNYFENPRHVIGTNEVDTLKNYLILLVFNICLT